MARHALTSAGEVLRLQANLHRYRSLRVPWLGTVEVRSPQMIELRLFGSVSLRDAGGEELAPVLAQQKRLALLAYLALAAPRGILHRDRIVGVFWPDLPQERARAALRKSLHFLRQKLPAEVIVGDRDEHVGIRPEALWCDAVEFRRAVQGREYVQALDLYHGDLLAGWSVSGAPEFEQWLERLRTELREDAARAALALSEGEVAQGSLRSGVLWARRAVSLAPDSEGAVQWLMYVQDRAGDRSGALATYRRFERQMDQEYGLTPAPETLELVREIEGRMAGQGPTQLVRLPAGVSEIEDDLYRDLVERSTDAFFRVNRSWCITFVNEAGARLLRVPAARLLGANVLRYVRQDTRRSLRDLVQAKLALGNAGFQYELPLHTPGKESWLSVSLQLHHRADGELFVQGSGRDVSAQRVADGALRQVAMVDSTTGLYNRRAMLLLTHERAKMARRVGQPLLMYLAELAPRPGGSPASTEAIDADVAAIAKLLRETFRESDLLARIGPRTFVVIAPEEREDGAGVIESRFRQRLRELNGSSPQHTDLLVSTHVMRMDPGSTGSLHQHLRRGERNVHLAAVAAR